MNTKKKTVNNLNSYFPHTDKQPKIVLDFVENEILKGQSFKVRQLFYIIRKSQEINLGKEESMTPIHYELIKKKNYVNELEILKKMNVVKFTGFSKVKSKCRRYWIDWNTYEEIENLIPGRVKDFKDKNWEIYNAITGTKIRNCRNKSHEIYKNKKRDELIVSDIVAQGILPIEYCIFDYINVEDYLDYQRELCLCGHLTESEKLKYLNNERCYRNILMNGFEVDKNLLIYKPKYRGQKTGRRSEIGGGFQSCSREMKNEAFNFISHLNIKNYDLKSSQMYGLKYAFISAGFETNVIDRYFQIDKSNWAKQIEIDKDTWKGLMYGAYFGGFPTHYFKNDGSIKNIKAINMLHCEIVRKHICKYLKIKTWYNYEKKRHECEDTIKNTENIKKILLAFYKQNKEIIQDLKKWRIYLATKFYQENYVKKQGKEYIKNKSNMYIEMTQYMNEDRVISNKGKRDLASHILQGQEALYISNITSYTKEPDCPYKVISDQHDGLIVLGEIPKEYQERASRESGYEYGYMEEKEYI